MNDSSSYEESYEENEDDQLSNEEEEEIDEINDLILSNSDNSDDSDNSEDSETDVITLKSTMIFPKKSQNINKIQVIAPMPQLKGIVLSKQKQQIELPKKKVKKYSTDEIEILIQKMPGINVSNNPINYDRLDISDLLEKEAQESIKDFSMRKDITLKINRIETPKIKNHTCVVLGLMIAKKLRFGIKYDENTENLIKDILDMLT